MAGGGIFMPEQRARFEDLRRQASERQAFSPGPQTRLRRPGQAIPLGDRVADFRRRIEKERVRFRTLAGSGLAERPAGESLPGGVGMERIVPDKTGGADSGETAVWRRLVHQPGEEHARTVQRRSSDDAQESFQAIQTAAELNEMGYVPLLDDEGRLTPWRDSLRSGLQHHGLVPFPGPGPGTVGARYHDGQWYPEIKFDQSLAADPEYRKNFLRRFDDLAAAARLAAGDPTRHMIGMIPVPLPRVRPYRQMRRGGRFGPGQGHKLNQHASLRGYISRGASAAIRLPGNAFTEVGSPHYRFHRSLEKFWDQYRKGGPLAGTQPTILEYNRATHEALKAAGLPQDVATFVADVARRQLTVMYELPPTTRLPIPRRFGPK